VHKISFITQAEESHGSMAFIRVCLSVCLKTAETTVTKLASGIVLATHLILGQNVKVTGLQSKNVFRLKAIEWLA